MIVAVRDMLKRIYAMLTPWEESVVRVWSGTRNEKKFQGTAFLVSNKHLMTAAHVLHDEEKKVIPNNKIFFTGQLWSGVEKINDSWLDEENDLAVLELKKSIKGKKPIFLCDLKSGELDRDDNITIAGFTDKSEEIKIYKDKQIISRDGSTSLEIADCAIKKGMSGGPVIKKNGLVGITRFKAKDGASQVYFTPLHIIYSFLEKKGIKDKILNKSLSQKEIMFIIIALCFFIFIILWLYFALTKDDIDGKIKVEPNSKNLENIQIYVIKNFNRPKFQTTTDKNGNFTLKFPKDELDDAIKNSQILIIYKDTPYFKPINKLSLFLMKFFWISIKFYIENNDISSNSIRFIRGAVKNEEKEPMKKVDVWLVEDKQLIRHKTETDINGNFDIKFQLNNLKINKDKLELLFIVDDQPFYRKLNKWIIWGIRENFKFPDSNDKINFRNLRGVIKSKNGDPSEENTQVWFLKDGKRSEFHSKAGNDGKFNIELPVKELEDTTCNHELLIVHDDKPYYKEIDNIAKWGIVMNIEILDVLDNINDAEKTEFDPDIDVKFVWISPGYFQMGCFGEDCYENEKPEHKVHIEKGFWISENEITQKQWKKYRNLLQKDGASLLKDIPSSFREYGDECPMVATYKDVKTYLKIINEQAEYSYRLPTETEWEYACKSFGCIKSQKTDNSNIKNNISNTALFYMDVRVREWCSDNYSDYAIQKHLLKNSGNTVENRVIRGGSFYSPDQEINCTFRQAMLEKDCVSDVGFRIIREESTK